MEVSVPSNFRSVIVDFTVDLSTTFPEYAYLWAKWSNPALTDQDFKELYEYCLKVYPGHFFDILNQSEEMFSKSIVEFLPGVDFKLLFKCENISQTTYTSIWKYLQLILFTIVGSVKDKTPFGNSADLFEGVDESELHEKLTSSMAEISEFFSKATAEGMETDPGPGPGPGPGFEGLPDPEKLQEHLRKIMGGKIGALATELAEEISKDFTELIDETDPSIRSPQDVFKKLAKDPKKMMNMVKTVGSKLDAKMKSGEINREDIMKEASEIMQHMKDMGGAGGMDQFSEMMKNMATMKMPKNAKMDTNAMNRMSKMEATKERIRSKLREKQTEAYSLNKEGENKFVFRTADGSVQEKSSAALPHEQGYIDPSLLDPEFLSEPPKASKKKKGKK